MRLAFAYAGLLASASTAVAQNSTQTEQLIGLEKSQCKYDKNAELKRVIVMLDNAKVPNADRVLEQVGMDIDNDREFKFYKNGVFTCIVVETTQNCVEQLNGLVEVQFVEEDIRVQSSATQKAGSPWGLQDLSNAAGASGDPRAQTFTYSFDDPGLGAGVDIYVIDTGVRVSHAVFGGRATEGFSFNGTAADGDGHGTHVAGSAAGSKFGVAQNANIIAVKVLGDDGSGSAADTIAGMDWVINNHNKRKTQEGFVGSIMSMSWGLQGRAPAVEQVITGASDAGLHVSVAAGNEGVDACSTTPARLGGANSNVVTVGAVNIQNRVSSFSNNGRCVDIYAPGEQVLSAWNTGDNVINFLSGTSMATPYNSGVMATLMAQDPAGLGQNPAALKTKLLATARKDAVTGNLAGSANLVLSNGVNGNVKRSVATDGDAKRTVTGSPAAWAKDLAKNLGQRWVVHSDDSPVRF